MFGFLMQRRSKVKSQSIRIQTASVTLARVAGTLPPSEDTAGHLTNGNHLLPHYKQSKSQETLFPEDRLQSIKAACRVQSQSFPE